MLQIVKRLPFNSKKVVYREGQLSVYLYRPSELSKRFSAYNKRKNFQIWFKDGDRKFKPNHMRVFLDLNLRVRSRPALKKKLLTAFDNIFYGKDPEIELKQLNTEKFSHSLNSIIVTGVLSQLLTIEQEYAYNKKSKFSPPTLFYQGWIREFIDNPKEIDNMCMSVANRQPPLSKYVDLENRKNKKYVKSLKPLWYVTGE